MSVPMEGLSIGNQLRWLRGASEMRDDLDRMYELLAELEAGVGGKRILGECESYMRWPSRGVYFFFEPGEVRTDGRTPRVVRVGTHALKAGGGATLWDRLKMHRNGNHRASVFRKHVGDAIRRRDGLEKRYPEWGRGTSAPADVRHDERPLERTVSAYLSRTSLLWLRVPDEPGPQSERAFIERNAIALLSNYLDPPDPPSRGWLGLHCGNEHVQRSGLWNDRHTLDHWEPGFLDVLARYVELTVRPRRGG